MTFAKADAIIIMGRGIKPDGTLPAVAQARGKLGSNIFHEGSAPFVIVSSKCWGFQNHLAPITEAEAMKRFIMQLGIPEQVILKQERSEDTIAEALFTKKEITEKKGWKKLIIVTSVDHAFRTQYIVKQIFGPTYSLQFAEAPTDLSEKERIKTKKLEQRALRAAKRYFHNIAPGDTEAIQKMLFTKHPMYNGSILKPLLKKILRKQPYL